MKLTKFCGSLAVAASVLAIGSTASADDYVCVDDATLISDLASTAFQLRCNTSDAFGGGAWDANAPIWRKGRNGDGCDIHESLAKQLDEPRDPNSSDPPLVGGGKGKGNNVAAGAANDLANGKIDSARDHLENFIATMVYSANADGQDNQMIENDLIHLGEGYLGCFNSLHPETL